MAEQIIKDAMGRGSIGRFLVQGDSNGRIFLTLEIKDKECFFDMSPDSARRIGEALMHAAKQEAMMLTIKRGDYATHEN